MSKGVPSLTPPHSFCNSSGQLSSRRLGNATMDDQQTRPWQNWSGSVQCKPQQVAKPATIDALVRIIKACNSDNRQVRVVGSGHSFTPLVQTNDVLISLEHIQ